MSKPDRLSALMSRFKLSVALTGDAPANFLVIGERGTARPTHLLLCTDGSNLAYDRETQAVLLSADFSWGGDQNPLMAALPGTIRHALQDDEEMQAIVELLLTEQRLSRCGSASVLNRLGEILIVRLMRRQIEAGAMQSGLLRGLADTRLSRAIVAMHDRPSQAWRVDMLAEEAGLSVSRFAELFREAVGVTPLAYLRNWRLILAKQDIERGERVQRVASRYCYGSTEALSRAFSLTYGASPTHFRKSAGGIRAR